MSTFRRVILHIYFITFEQREHTVGRVFLTNDTKMNENEVTLEVNLVSSICWKGLLSQ